MTVKRVDDSPDSPIGPAPVAGDEDPHDPKLTRLLDLIEHDEPAAATMIVAEIGRDDATEGWLDDMVHAIENVQFEEPSQREAIATWLLRRARSLVESPRPDSEPVLWAAIRRYASLIAEAETPTLVTFLEHPGASIKTQQVVLQGIQNIFERHPPTTTEGLATLAYRVAGLCEKAIVVDHTASPELESLAWNAYLALASMNDVASIQLSRSMRQMGGRYLLRMAMGRLDRTRRRWQGGGFSNPMILTRCLAILGAGRDPRPSGRDRLGSVQGPHQSGASRDDLRRNRLELETRLH